MPITASGKYAKPETKAIYRYPLSYANETQDGRDYLILRIKRVNYEKSSPTSLTDNVPYNSITANAKKQIEVSRIYLPIPQNLQDSNSMSWSGDAVGPLGAAAYNEATSLITDPAASYMRIQQLLSGEGISKNLELTSELQTEITSYLAGAAASQFGNINPQSIVTRATGQVLQSNLELLFQGVNLRSFSFPFSFTPRSEEEADEIKGIIRTLKKHSAAKNSSGSNNLNKIFIKSPDVFELQFKRGKEDHPFLNQFKTCALSNLSFNYTGTGNYATYKRGEPVQITMNLTFQEIIPVYAEDYDKDKGTIGLGY